jgi:hypothetical protein
VGAALEPLEAMQRHPLDFVSTLGFLLVLAVAGLACYRRPSWGASLLLIADPFTFSRDLWHTTITLPKAVLLGVLIALAAKRSSLRSLWWGAVRPLTFAAAALTAATALTVIPGLYIDAVARETLKSLEYALAFACCVVAWTEDPDPRPFRIALLAVVGAVSLAALAQEFSGAPSGAYIAGRVAPRIAGPLEGPNQLSGYLGLAIPVLLAYAFLQRDLSALGVAALASLTLCLTLSRTGIATTLLAVVLLLVTIGRPNARIAFAAAAGILALAFAGLAAVGALPRIVSFSQVGAPTGLATRSQLWSAALALWKSSPWLGIGAGNYELQLPSVGLEGVRTHANSLYLQALAEGGIPLFLATLWSVYASIAAFVRARSLDPVVVGVMAASTGLAIHQIFDFLVFYPKVGEFWWILLGAAGARLALTSAPSSRFEEARIPGAVSHC